MQLILWSKSEGNPSVAKRFRPKVKGVKSLSFKDGDGQMWCDERGPIDCLLSCASLTCGFQVPVVGEEVLALVLH